MAELKCSDGTVIHISKETESELRKAFEKRPVPIIRVATFDESRDRVILNLPDHILADEYKGDFICLDQDGVVRNRISRDPSKGGGLYVYYDNIETIF